MKQRWSQLQQRLNPSPRTASHPRPAPLPAWQTFLSHVTSPPDAVSPRAILSGELIYVLDLARSVTAGGLVVELLARERKKSGAWTRPKPVTINRHDVARLPDERDRRILDAVCGATHAYGYSGPAWGGYDAGLPVPSAFVLSLTLQRDLAERLCDTDRLLVRSAASPSDAAAEFVPVEWDPQPAEFQLQITGNADAGYTIGGVVRRDGHAHPFADVLFVTAALIVWRPAALGGSPRIAAFDTGGAERWMAGLLGVGTVTVPAEQATTLLETLVTSDPVRLECPDELRVDPRVEQPQPMRPHHAANRLRRRLPAVRRSTRREAVVQIRRL